MKNIIRNNKGFTIIEVVLVLAIAGLIFLVVFLALPQLQASRRDTQRKSDASRFLAAIENSAGNHNGVYPKAGKTTGLVPGTSDSEWADANIAGDFKDPSSADFYGPYLTSQPAVGDITDPGTIYYSLKASCKSDGTDGFVTLDKTDRQVAVQMWLESGVFCQDNQ